MNPKALYAAIAVVVLIIIGLVVYNQSQNDATEVANQNQSTNTETTDTTNDSMTPAPSTSNTPTGGSTAVDQGTFSDENDNTASVFEITYDGSKYTPSTLSIKNGDVVVFKNASSKSFWPASAPHPQHTNYPEFDPKKALGAGQNFEFKFTKTGEWGFHDHLNPSAFGKITVK